MVRKILDKNSPGTADTFAADDWDYINKYLTGVNQSAVDPVIIATNTTYWDNCLRLYNPARTFSYNLRTLGITANRNLTLPLLVVDDEIVCLQHPQRMQNKEININENTLKHGTTNGIGDLLVGNGTKYDRLPMSSNAGYHLAIKSDLSGLEWVIPVTGAGEVNTATNLGTAGVGVYHSKSGVQLRFKKINATPNGRINVTDDTTNNEIDIGIQPGADGQFLKTVGTTPTWSTLTSQYGTVMPDGSNYSGTKWGRFMGGAYDGEGLFGGLQIHGEDIKSGTSDQVYTQFTSESEDDALAGFQTRGYVARRTYNPKLNIRFRHDLSTEKGWTGFLRSDTYPTGGGGDNPLNNLIGAMVGYSDTDPNWLIRWNDGSGVPQTFNMGFAKDTNFHTIEFSLNNAAGSLTVRWDDVVKINGTTTAVPPATNGMHVYCIVESVGGTATPISVDYAYMTFN